MDEKLRFLIEKKDFGETGPFGIGFKDLTTGEELFRNADTVFPTASVFKVFVLCELFRRQKAGLLDLNEKHTLLESEKSMGSGLLELIGEGAVFSLMDYVMLMMSISDNTASDYLFKLAGPENIRKYTLEPLGLLHSRCDLNCIDMLAYSYGVSPEEYRRVDAENGRFHSRNGSYFACREPKNDQSTPRDMIRLFSMLYKGEVTGSETDDRMLSIMKKCQTNARIPAQLPNGVTVAHKTGGIDHCANDCGIVYTSHGAYALALFYNGNLASEEEYEGTSWASFGTSLLARVSGEIYRMFTGESV